MRLIRLEDMTEKDWAALPWGKELSPEELTEAYALLRANFTAADLQKYTELDEGVPMEDVLRELEEAQRQHDQRNQ